ncbi:MAG: Sensory box histidine kinase/response regulator [Gammaproteobacteria bacterium]|jgi:NO-binding membrane sensor protein with MHYT domain|nr:Sensory box histidine kinase/response regulator [Gammaproteobacteria bacterium]
MNITYLLSQKYSKLLVIREVKSNTDKENRKVLSSFFQLGPIPSNHITGYYDIHLVILSYLVSTMASYIALDITGRLRDVGNTRVNNILWLLGGSFAMGAGIWSMHFIGMLAFKMPMMMDYDPFLTGLSMIVAILASSFALFLLREKIINIPRLGLGGVILGLAIASMHYVGMAAMTTSMNIRYIPWIFFVSIVIAIVASEAALYLALNSNQGAWRRRIRLKLISAAIMGAAICGMHYSGMEAAIFTPKVHAPHLMSFLDPHVLSIAVTIVTFFILGIAIAASTYKEILNYQTIKFARQAGMAEVASSVLHNIGNVLNSVNVSANLVAEHMAKSKLIGLVNVSSLLNEHQQDLSAFIMKDPQGTHLLHYLKMLAEYWQKEQSFIVSEMSKLITSIQHIKEVIAMQQTLSGVVRLEELCSIEGILDESLAMINIDSAKHRISMEKHYSQLGPVLIDKTKLMQVVINLIRNAKDSLTASSSENRMLSIETGKDNENSFFIQITDNGVGIPPENLTKIFSHGFTTKKTGHGFGLHASALAIKEMGGSLQAESEGTNKGAKFTIILPHQL